MDEEILGEVEPELSMGIEVDEDVRDTARGRILDSYEKVSPALFFFQTYEGANDEVRAVMFRLWRNRFLSRASDNPTPAIIQRRFGQYLRLGANDQKAKGRQAARQGFADAGGGEQLIQYLLGKRSAVAMPEWLWVAVYTTRIQLNSDAAREFVDNDPVAVLMTPMIYVGHRRDSKQQRDHVRMGDAGRGNSINGMNIAIRRLLDAGLTRPVDFDFVEIKTEHVLGRVDHGHGLEASNAVDASVVEDLERLDAIEAFLNGAGPRVFNSKIDNSLLGITNVSGLIGRHDQTPADLDVAAIRRKLDVARRRLIAKRRAYERLFIKDADGNPILPRAGVTRDGLGQRTTGELSRHNRRNLLRAMNAAA